MSSAWSVTIVPNQSLSLQITGGIFAMGSGSPLWEVSAPNPVPGTVITLLLSAPRALVIDTITRATTAGSMTGCVLSSTTGGSQSFDVAATTQVATSTLAVAVNDVFRLTLGTGSVTGLAIQIQGHYV